MSPERRWQVMFGALAALAVPLAFISVAFLGARPGPPGEVAACLQLAAFTGLLLSPVIFRPAGERLTSPEVLKKICTLWLWISGLTHVTWELSWCFMHSRLHGVDGGDTWAWIWWIYGVADRRFLTSDSFVVAREWMAAIVEGPLNLFILYLLRQRRTLFAALALIVVSTMEITGTSLYFASEAFNGFANVDGGFVNFWIKFVVLTFFWIGFPMISLYSAARMLGQTRTEAVSPEGPAEPVRDYPDRTALGWGS